MRQTFIVLLAGEHQAPVPGIPINAHASRAAMLLKRCAGR
ncbi:hypothetical protein ASZ90_016105 [hydrocarbon metagenome]|uniref:Uncharacterized protein n=1 Tax=hydrocarbon metagenome TaxID=938273 RepID=A0A0W8F044_9ZZZZ